MSRPWDLYLHKQLISLEEAAFLWLEIEPNQGYDYVPFNVLQMKRILEEKLFALRHPNIPFYNVDGSINAFAPRYAPTASPNELKEIAKQLGENPKFLFPEAREQESNGWNKGEISKSSYQELIKILAHALNIDLTDKESGGAILIKAGLAKIKLSDATVRKILDEIHPSRLNNSNRKKPNK